MREPQARPAEQDEIILEVVVKPYKLLSRERPPLPENWEHIMANEIKVIRNEFRYDIEHKNEYSWLESS